MCLTRISEQKIAENNIFCWKTLTDGNISIYNSYQYRLGVVQPSIKIKPTITIIGDQIIEEGYHSWVNRPFRSKLSNNSVYLCVIPKGTIYYQGMENSNAPGYTSETLVVLGPVEYNFFGQIGTWLRKQKYIGK